jgi:hypothetical protein
MEYFSLLEYFFANYYSVITDCITTTIGATVGFIFALIVYWIGEVKIKNKERYNEKVIAYNILKKFNLLLTSVIKNCEEQNTEFELFSKNLTESPLENILPQIYATNNRKRLMEFDNHELFNAYMLFDKLNDKRIEDYRTIFNYADYVYFYYLDLISQNEKHLNFTHKDSKVLETSTLNIILKIQLRLFYIINTTPNFETNTEYIFLRSYENKYKSIKGSDFTNLQSLKDEFLLPLQNEIFSNTQDKQIAFDVIYETALAITKLNTVKLNSIEHAKQYREIKTKESLKFLKDISNKLEQIKEPKK